MKRNVAFATALLLTACAGPKHAPPPDAAIYPPAKWRTAANAGPEIDATWWQNFNDPALSARSGLYPLRLHDQGALRPVAEKSITVRHEGTGKFVIPVYQQALLTRTGKARSERC